MSFENEFGDSTPPKRVFGRALIGFHFCKGCGLEIFPLRLKERQDDFEWEEGEYERRKYLYPKCPKCKLRLSYDEAS